ncbi:MAG: hypothetical protein QXG79_05615 [Saccharolobus sp.]
MAFNTSNIQKVFVKPSKAVFSLVFLRNVCSILSIHILGGDESNASGYPRFKIDVSLMPWGSKRFMTLVWSG